MQVAIIGSFKQYYEEVMRAWNMFADQNFTVSTPKGSTIIESGIDFVRFKSDDFRLNDLETQTVAMHRILRSDLVYVVAPDGYVGRTTCYEIGRVIQCDRPIYFSEHLRDLPIAIPKSHVVAIEDIAARFGDELFLPEPLYNSNEDRIFGYERLLTRSVFLEDEDLFYDN